MTHTDMDEPIGKRDSGGMSEAAKKLLHTFDSLPEAERRQVAFEILRRTALADHDLPTDAELVAAADEVFLDLDRGETEK